MSFAKDTGRVIGGTTDDLIGAVATGNLRDALVGAVIGAVGGGALGAGVDCLLGAHSYACWKASIFTGRPYRGTCDR